MALTIASTTGLVANPLVSPWKEASTNSTSNLLVAVMAKISPFATGTAAPFGNDASTSEVISTPEPFGNNSFLRKITEF